MPRPRSATSITRRSPLSAAGAGLAPAAGRWAARLDFVGAAEGAPEAEGLPRARVDLLPRLITFASLEVWEHLLLAERLQQSITSLGGAIDKTTPPARRRSCARASRPIHRSATGAWGSITNSPSWGWAD